MLQIRLKPYVGKSLAELAFDKGFWNVYELLDPTMVYVQSYLSDMLGEIERKSIFRSAVSLTELLI